MAFLASPGDAPPLDDLTVNYRTPFLPGLVAWEESR
jgi:hypothetical protein